jgi:fumarate reductase flavoprotein subunit
MGGKRARHGRSMSDTLDLLVIGAGACGLAGAIAAHDAGGSVAILESRDRPGGNSALSTGSIPGAGSKYQRAAGIDDSPARMIDDLLGVAGPHDADDLTAMIAHECAPLCEWLIDDLGARMELITAYRHIGHSVERLHAPSSRRGQDLVDDLLRFVAERDIPIAVGNKAEALIVEDGAVMGATVNGEAVRARKVLLATNGFAADPALVARHCPEIAAAEYFGAPGSTGDAVRWGESLGAALGNMAAYQGYAAVAYPQGQLLSWTTLEGPFAWAIYDARIHDVAMAEEEYAEMSAMGAIAWAQTPAALAAKLGIGEGGLATSIARYNAAAQGGAADDHGRAKFAMAPLQAPFAGVKVKPGLFHTQGGLLVDAQAHVRKAAGGIVPNLFAGGGAAAGISGRAGALGYASGNGLITALVLGRRAGITAMEEVRAGA